MSGISAATFAEEALFTEEAASGNKKSEEKETLIYESPIFTDGGEAFIPEETRSEGEKEYRLVSKRIRNAKKAGEITYAQVTIPYDLEGDDTVPETADVPLIDEESGTEFERELSLVDVEETSRSWSDTFSFSVTVSGYGQIRSIWEIWRFLAMKPWTKIPQYIVSDETGRHKM